MWERYGVLVIAACVLLVVARRRLARLRVVRGQEGRRGRRRIRGRDHARQRGQAQGGRGGLRQDRDRSGTASYRMLAKFREAARARAPRPQGRGRDLRRARRRQRHRPRASGSRRGARRHRSWSTPRPTTTSGAARAADRAGPHVPPQRARGACALGLAANDMTAMRRWTDMIIADAETPPGTRGQIQMLLALSDSRQEELRHDDAPSPRSS